MIIYSTERKLLYRVYLYVEYIANICEDLLLYIEREREREINTSNIFLYALYSHGSLPELKNRIKSKGRQSPIIYAL